MAKIIRNGIEYGAPSYSKSEIDRKLSLKVSKSEVESELNESSNPVQSRVVKKALEDRVPQYTTMPMPNVDNVGAVAQYVGTTTVDFTNGFFYEVVEDSSSVPTIYSWQPKNVQSGVAIRDVDTLPTDSDIEDSFYRKTENSVTATLNEDPDTITKLSQIGYTYTQETESSVLTRVYRTTDKIRITLGSTDYGYINKIVYKYPYPNCYHEFWCDGTLVYSANQTGAFSSYTFTNESSNLYIGDSQNQTTKRIVEEQDIPKVFTGSRDDWDSLSSEQKKQYDYANFTGDSSGGGIADVVEENNMNAVTSNAVYQKFEETKPPVRYANISLNTRNVPNITAISGQGLRAIRMGNVLMLNYYLKVTTSSSAVTSKAFFDLSSLNVLLNTGESIMDESKLPQVGSILLKDQTGSSSGTVSMNGLNTITIPSNRSCNIIGQIILAIKHS